MPTSTPVARLALLAGLTLALGISVALAWFIVGGRVAASGPGEVLRERPHVVYGLVAVFALALGTATGRLLGPGRRALTAGLLVGAWIGELVVLIVSGQLLANELVPGYAPTVWLLGTGGPLQPVAAIIGGVAGARLAPGGRAST